MQFLKFLIHRLCKKETLFQMQNPILFFEDNMLHLEKKFHTNYLMNSFLKFRLNDLCVSETSILLLLMWVEFPRQLNFDATAKLRFLQILILCQAAKHLLKL